MRILVFVTRSIPTKKANWPRNSLASDQKILHHCITVLFSWFGRIWKNHRFFCLNKPRASRVKTPPTSSPTCACCVSYGLVESHEPFVSWGLSASRLGNQGCWSKRRRVFGWNFFTFLFWSFLWNVASWWLWYLIITQEWKIERGG